MNIQDILDAYSQEEEADRQAAQAAVARGEVPAEELPPLEPRRCDDRGRFRGTAKELARIKRCLAIVRERVRADVTVPEDLSTKSAVCPTCFGPAFWVKGKINGWFILPQGCGHRSFHPPRPPQTVPPTTTLPALPALPALVGNSEKEGVLLLEVAGA